MRTFFAILLSASLAGAAPPAWVARSNDHARVALEPIGRFAPEQASSLGLEEYDQGIRDLKPELFERTQEANRAALSELRKRVAAEKDQLVRQDLEIMVQALELEIRSNDLRQKHRIPYVSMSQAMFRGLAGLLDPQIADKRRPAAVVRLRKYAGVEPGFTPLTVLMEQRIRERLNVPGLIGPPRDEVEKDLKNSPTLINGIGQLFQKFKLIGYEDAYAKLKEQIAAYDDFVRKEILPRSRTDFRLPPELYANNLENLGVDIPPAQLAGMAHKAFDEIQRQMQEIAARIAKEKKLPSSDYRDVIRELKKQQLTPDQTLQHYHGRIRQIEAIIRRENLVSLPARPARMRLATPAESAVQPAPHMRPPRLIGNTGESGEFVLPLVNPNAPGARMDDFTFEAASWTLTAHEARPGHEMQFSAMVETGVSTARAVFAFNSTNVEGWGLYSEWMMFPFMPDEGKLISLQNRMMRAARAFLDPELQAGKVTPVQAKAVLMNDVMLSDAMATQEVDRYTFRAPGQATSYFYGYTRLLELRGDIAKKLGAKFNAREFHDFVLSQGLLPPRVLRTAVMERFVR
jgi:hypothetical protein